MIEKLTDWLAKKGNTLQTPCYVFDAEILNERLDQLEKSLGTQVVMSLKANPNIDLLMRITHRTCSVEAASLKELNLVAKSGQIYINNLAMDRNLIRAGLAAKASFIIDSPQQLATVFELAGTRPIEPVILRLNACVLNAFLEKPLTLRPDHFGMDWKTSQDLVETIRNAAGRVQLAGFHLFAGSHAFNRSAFPIVEAVPRMIAEFEQRYGGKLTTVNLGGGLPERWSEQDFDFASYRSMLQKIPSHIKVLHESGRALFASCGAFIVTVLSSKQIDGRHFAICDGGMNQNFLLCQTENHFGRPRQPYVIRAAGWATDADDPTIVTSTLVGSTCSRDDVIGQVEGPPLKAGDLCLFDYCGAYHSTYTVAPFLGLKEAAYYVSP